MLSIYNACLATMEMFCGTLKDKLCQELGLYSFYNKDLENYTLFLKKIQKQ